MGTGMQKKRYVLVGAGFRGLTMFARPLLRDFTDVVELVAVCDLNPKRLEGALNWLGHDLPRFTDFDKMLAETRPDCVIIATRDCTHADLVVRALRAGVRVYVEKPLCTTAAQCLDILNAVRETGNTCLTTHNLRYDSASQSIYSILHQGRIGKPLFVQFEETLNRSHGSDYFRRWHRIKANSGGLQIHKASHHFDLLNWWIGSKPATVSAQGGQRFYGGHNAFHGQRCRGCQHAARCPLYVDYEAISLYKQLYFNAEEADGYFRDACPFDPSIDIEDQLAVHIRYENGVEVSYTLVAYSPFSSMRVTVEGSGGRLEHQSAYSSGLVAALSDISRETQRVIRPHEPVCDVPIARTGGDHGGADPMLLQEFVRRDWSMAGVEQAVQAVLIGIAANQSLATGRPVDVQKLIGGVT